MSAMTMSGLRDRVHLSAACFGAAVGAALYLVLTIGIIPGITVILAAFPAVVQFGILLLLSSGTRLLAGWFAVRRLRAHRGLRRRGEGVPTSALSGVLAWMMVTGLSALLGELAGVAWASWLLLVEFVRWPIETVLGGLLALSGPADQERADWSVPRS